MRRTNPSTTEIQYKCKIIDKNPLYPLIDFDELIKKKKFIFRKFLLNLQNTTTEKYDPNTKRKPSQQQKASHPRS